MTTAIAFEDVSKHYRGAEYRMFRDDLSTAAAHLLRRAPPTHDVVRALDGVSFEIPEGQSSALIGLNGAGKTTALKLATRIAYPTEGRIRVRGRVGALIEVGTGMHPELTGRENVQLYGRILGLSRRDINERFDRIVEFADIGEALDRPVKQFSSGMQLRLGFALASHLEPDILLVDEAIAVGDAGFQFRCVARMSELVREGRTLILVSHNLSAIETLCQNAILLRAGRVAADGNARDVVRQYLQAVQVDLAAAQGRESTVRQGSPLELTKVTILDRHGNELDAVKPDEPTTVRAHYRAHERIERPIFSVGLNDGQIGCFTVASMLVDGQAPAVIEGEGHVDCTWPSLPLFPRSYWVWLSVRGASGFGDIVDWQQVAVFSVVDDLEATGRGAATHSMADAPVKLPYTWRFSAAPSQGR